MKPRTRSGRKGIVRLYLELPKRRMTIGIVAALMLGAAYVVWSSTLTLTTIYPAPSGVYKALITTGGTTTSPLNTLLARNAGEVGIGTSTPSTELEVDGTTSYGIQKVISTAANGEASIGFRSSNVADGAAGNWLIGANLGGTGLFSIWGGGIGTVMSVNSSGDIGIGTTSPAATLDIYGANTGVSQSNVGGALFRALDGESRPSIEVYGNIDGTALADSIASALAVREQSGTGRSITTSGSIAVGNGGGSVYSYFQGRLGIGTASPSQTLEVNGNAQVDQAFYVTGNSSLAGTLTVGGAVTASDYYFSSDERLKTAIRPIAHALDRLLAIRGVSFQWKKNGKPDLGVMAQNVEKVFPELVTKDKKGFESAEYGNLIAPTIEAIRELKAQVETLKKSENGLEDRVSELKHRVRELESENRHLRGV